MPFYENHACFNDKCGIWQRFGFLKGVQYASFFPPYNVNSSANDEIMQ